MRNFPKFSKCGEFFWRISEEFLETFPVTDSSEILEKFPRIDPQDKIFGKSQFSDSLFEKFLRISPNISPEIPEKFLGLGHYVYGFLGELDKRISF